MRRYGRCVKIRGRLVPCVQVGPVLIPLLALAKKESSRSGGREKAVSR